MNNFISPEDARELTLSFKMQQRDLAYDKIDDYITTQYKLS